MKIRKKTVGSVFLFLFILSLALIIYKEIELKPHHQARLDSILTLGSKETRPKAKQAMQFRKNGKRELYRQGEGKQLLIRYADSLLTLDKDISSKNFNEQMKEVVLIREDGASYTVMEAENASIAYETGEIAAHDVIFKKTNDPSFEQGVMFSGSAKKVHGNIVGVSTGVISGILLKTSFGSIQADSAESDSPSKDGSKKMVFVFSKNVVIELNGGEKIFCDKAMLDTGTMHGVCLGEINPVRVEASYNTSKPFQITCSKISFSYEESLGQNSLASIQNIRGEGNVCIEALGISASGDVIELEGGNPSCCQYQLSSISPNLCLFKTPFGLQIKSPKINSEKECICFQDPIGDCAYEGKKMDFSSDFLTWDPARRIMNLEGDSKILLPSLSWSVNGTVSLFFAEGFSLEGFGAMPARIVGAGEMLFKDIKRGMTLEADGKAEYSANENKLTIDSVQGSKQIHIVDRFGQIFSNKAVFLLDAESKLFEVENITLLGNVSLINKMYSTKEQEASQFILADKALIGIKQESACLTADKGKRVLIMDKLNRMQVSAPSITIKRSEGIIPFSIKGTGDVRFSFKDDELKEIKKRFLEWK